MFNLNLELRHHEAEALAECVKDNMDSLNESYSIFDSHELPKRSFEMYLLSKLYNALPKEKVATATNENDQFENTY